MVNLAFFGFLAPFRAETLAAAVPLVLVVAVRPGFQCECEGPAQWCSLDRRAVSK